MKDLRPLSINEAPEKSQELLTKIKSQVGFLPNLMAMIGNSPAALQAYKSIEAASLISSLSPKERNIILLAASVQNSCTYCVASHSTVLKHLFSGDETVAQAIQKGERLADEKLNALVEFTKEMVSERGFISERTKEAFLKVGYTEVNMLDVIVGVAQKTISNYADHLFPVAIESTFEKQLVK